MALTKNNYLLLTMSDITIVNQLQLLTELYENKVKEDLNKDTQKTIYIYMKNTLYQIKFPSDKGNQFHKPTFATINRENQQSVIFYK